MHRTRSARAFPHGRARLRVLDAFSAAVTVLGLLLLSPPAAASVRPLPAAQGLPAQPPAADPAAPRIALASQLELSRLVDLAAQRLAVRIDYEPTSLKGAVTLRGDAPLSDLELWTLLNRLLASRGYTTVQTSESSPSNPGAPPNASAPTTSAFTVVRIADAAATAVPLSLTPINDPPAPEASSPAMRPAAGDESSRRAQSPTPGYRAVVLKAFHRPVKELIDPLAKVLSKPSTSPAGPGSPAGIITPLGDAGLFIIADLSPRIDQALQLLQLLDTPLTSIEIEYVPLTNLAPQPMAALAATIAGKRDALGGGAAASTAPGAPAQPAAPSKLGEVLPAPDGAGVLVIAPRARIAEWRSLIERLDQREGVLTQLYAPSTFALAEVAELIDQTIRDDRDDRWKLVEDRLTSSLILTATPTQHSAVRALIDRLDALPPEARRPVRTFKIRNRDVREMASLLRELLDAGVLDPDPASSPPPAGAALSTPPNPQTLLRPELRPEARAATAPLPVDTTSARPGQSAAGGPTDVRQPPRLALTTDQTTSSIIAVGEPAILAKIAGLLVTLDVRQPQVMLEAMLISLSDSQSLALGVELEKLELSGDTFIRLSSLFGLSSSSGTDSARTRTTGDAPGFSGVVLNPGDFSIIIRALETINDGRSLSVPKVLVSNNQQATFNSTVQQPFAATNASDTVATTSFGGTFDAGTTISARPQITDGDQLLLDYNVSLSSFVGSSSTPELPPPRQQNNISSSATIPDGYVVVVGGIEVTTQGESVSQVPIVGSIPLIGELFKNRSTSTTRSRFFVFLRATVLRGQSLEGLKFLSDHDTAAARVDDGWPTVEPRVIR